MNASVEVAWLRVGSCRHLACMAARGAGLRQVDFPSYCALLRHPTRGWMLYDTGYAPHFLKATAAFPERLYGSLLPVNLPVEECLSAQLAARGIRCEEITTVIVSHYHGDHVAGLRDFPQARFIALRAESEHVLALRDKRWRATVQGRLPGMLPDDFSARLEHADDYPQRPLPAWMAPFRDGVDLFGDGSLLGVALPGHSHGQLGLCIPNADSGPVLLVADACYSLPACREGRLPPTATQWFSNSGVRAYRETFAAVGELARREPSLLILPSHCEVAAEVFHARP